MNALILTTALLLSGSDALKTTKISGLTLRAPAEWQSAPTDVGRKWTPGSEADLEISVWPVDPKRTPQECLDQLIAKLHENMGTDGWERTVVGTQPAVRKITTDYIGNDERAKTPENKVTTVTTVGCNGITKWVLTMSSVSSKSPRYGAVLKAVIGSIVYGK